MAVLPEYRKSAAALVLTRKLFELSLGRYAKQLFCVSCEPALVGMYERMGYRAIAPAWAKDSGGFRVPLLLAGYDEDHLRRVRSPLLPVLQARPRPWPEAGVSWSRATPGLFPAEFGIRRWSASRYEPALDRLTAGLSDDGRAALLTNAIEVEARVGDHAFCEGDGVPGLVVVLSGGAELRRCDRLVAKLGPGDVGGVATTVLRDARQASLVVDRELTRLLLLSRNAVERLRDPDDRAALWHNLASFLAERTAEPQA